ncbi:MAG: DEP domain-containing protein [Burkholderiales bacterium]
MSKHAVLAIASQAQESLLRAALESQGVSVTTVPPAAHLETEVMRAMHGAADPPLVVLDLVVLAQLATPVAVFCSWKNSRCGTARLVLYGSNLLSVRGAEQGWAQRHGALQLLCGCSGRHWPETVTPALRALLAALGMGDPDEAKLAQAVTSLARRYLDSDTVARGRSQIERLGALGIRPAEFVAAMRARDGLAVMDRSYHMIHYAECFVGSEAVDWIVRRNGLSREQAVAAGQVLLELGELYHVAREQPFLDGHFFYRLAAEDSARLGGLDLAALIEQWRSPRGVPIRDRAYRAITFPACFVGAESVDWLRREQGLSHNEAMTLGQRLMDLFVFHHVANEHPFKDGHYYYRFYEDERFRS